MAIDGAAGEGPEARLTVYTTRPDTVPGVTFVALAPEHPAVERITAPEQRAVVAAYREQAARRSDIDRIRGDRACTGACTGAFTGAYAINPLNDERVPVYVADYVLMSHGSGAIMGVPAHDERDFEFAARHGVPVKVVVTPPGWNAIPPDARQRQAPRTPGPAS